MENDEASFNDIKHIVWGENVNEDLFRRWSQGFVFSPDEPTALIQKDGGPCGVIAPVQAFLLKSLINTNGEDNTQWRNITPEQVDAFLCTALKEILHQAATCGESNDENAPTSSSTTTPVSPAKLKQLQSFTLPPTSTSSPQSPPTMTNTSDASIDTNSGSGTTTNVVIEKPKSTPKKPQYCLIFLNEPLSSRINSESVEPMDIIDVPPSIIPESNKIFQRPEYEIFHRNLRVLKLEHINQVEKVLREKIECLKGYYGILQFLYSVILTKSIENLTEEMSESTELIDPIHGHGSQSLINLILTGRGVCHVFDNDQDVGGLKLKGITQQSEVGFLTLLERLRYIEVGSYLKNPRFPVWVVASETHLTVLFSTNLKLVAPESAGEIARRVFKTYDPEGNNFIASILLEDVLRSLGLYSHGDYVEIMKKKLDPETLGIILLNDFMDEFFPFSERTSAPDTFTLFHYNGLARSSVLQKVIYYEGNAILLESDIRCLSENNKILTCLQTKWPSIDIQWTNNKDPSIN